MKLTIVKYPHPALRHQSKPLTSIDNDARRQAATPRAARAMSRARSRVWRDRRRADRRRGVRRGVEPARAPCGGRAWRARRRDRARLRRSTVPGARLGERAGDRHRPGPGRRRRDARRDPGRHPARRRRAGRLHADRRTARPRRRIADGSSTRIRRCCPRSRAPMRSATPSPTAWRSPAARSISSTRLWTAARSSPRRRSRSSLPTTPRRSTTGSARSSTGCCRAPWRCCWPVRSRSIGRRGTIDLARADARVPVPRRALLSVSDKTGLVGSRPWAGRARVRARVHRRDGACTARGGPAGDRRRGRDRQPGDARRPGQDPASARPRRDPRRPSAGRASAGAPGRGDRPVRARRRQPLPVRGRASSAPASPSTS